MKSMENKIKSSVESLGISNEEKKIYIKIIKHKLKKAKREILMNGVNILTQYLKHITKNKKMKTLIIY